MREGGRKEGTRGGLDPTRGEETSAKETMGAASSLTSNTRLPHFAPPRSVCQREREREQREQREKQLEREKEKEKEMLRCG
jgi:hypothetical protein